MHYSVSTRLSGVRPRASGPRAIHGNDGDTDQIEKPSDDRRCRYFEMTLIRFVVE